MGAWKIIRSRRELKHGLMLSPGSTSNSFSSKLLGGISGASLIIEQMVAHSIGSSRLYAYSFLIYLPPKPQMAENNLKIVTHYYAHSEN